MFVIIVHVFFKPMMELVFSKAVEIGAEAIPAAVLQTYAFVTNSQRQSLSLFSIIVSVLVSHDMAISERGLRFHFRSASTESALLYFSFKQTVAYSVTIIGFDLDLDPEKRVINPTFYGFIPNR